MAEIYERVKKRDSDIQLKMKFRDWRMFPDNKFPFLGAILSEEGYPKYAYHTTHFQLVEIEIIPDDYMYEKYPHSSKPKAREETE
jgi:hypothetical protein